MENSQKARIKLIVSLVAIFLGGFIGYSLYSDSLENDFKNISTTEIERVGDPYTGYYHRPGCPKAKSIVKVVDFNKGATAEENNKQAKEEGFLPCKRCHPDD